MSKIKLGYWNIRALAEPIRYALEYTGEDYEERSYVMGHGPEFDRSQWLKEKHSLGLDFPNLPYLIDGSLKITESVAILKHVCRKHGLVPKSLDDIAQAEMVEGNLVTLKNAFYGQFFTSNFEEARKNFEDKLPAMLQQFTNYLSPNSWLMGDKITYVDFYFYTHLKQILCLLPNCLSEFAVLEGYVKKFEALPKIKEYLASGKFFTYPITNPFVCWGYEEEK